MKTFEVLLSQTAAKELRDLNLQQAEKIKEHLKELEKDPFRPRPRADIKKLSSSSECYRLRVGDYRAIYFIEGGQVKVTEIMRRGKGYAWLE